MTLRGKHIIAGLTGSIAAYKAAMLVRLLTKEGAEVQIVMTPTAKQFISPLTMATLSKHPVRTDFFNPENGEWNSHVNMGIWADALLIAPATANTIAKMATGTADNLLLTTCLSARCPVWVAPAMDTDMFLHPATIRNIETLRQRGVHLIEPAAGELASGLEGKGRMEEPEIIVKRLAEYFVPKDFHGRKILITAGPTQEPIDPVRFIGNYSTGKMGYALAKELAQRGAEVLLIAGPTEHRPQHPNITLTGVQTAAEMYDAAVKAFPDCAAAILTAAVADFTPANVYPQKITEKKEFALPLLPTKDIAAELGRMKQAQQILAGFALETHNETEHAQQKLQNKNFDFIVLNSLNDAGAGFGYDTNRISILSREGNIRRFDLKNKTEVAEDIANHLLTCLKHCIII
ncbi:MAG: bifunctional phosphopantothenoylcysteine decarboxylase/phosphopantothenate--cysteine ligase CoaBC [Bacteroidales bacterium]|jgi:phosphopantothenoylcysteine decarboxylase/phosphopantothenate--cysteine ligase|nr:bifunctional phosphopantothenoylcysteine decarboxylase/phosphopantothenate--cysteine ligase CoaBC [Bacteroidales bacterium]